MSNWSYIWIIAKNIAKHTAKNMAKTIAKLIVKTIAKYIAKTIAKNKGAQALILVDEYLFRRYKSRFQYSDSGRGEKRMALGNDEENNFQVILFYFQGNLSKNTHIPYY